MANAYRGLMPGVLGTGSGRALMIAALGHLARAAYQQATLWVLDTNARARRFYELAGFHADGADRQAMAITLPSS